ncbi:MAG: peptidase M64 [Bacteroidales bacterium]|nr:peptidase M64 [Bacteroidales bacterium]
MKKILLIISLLVSIGCVSAQKFDSNFEKKSMRFDYFRTGNSNTELISHDHIFQEPHWGGSFINLIDTFNYGNYKFEVLDSVSGKLLYSKGFSSLFFEWRYTEEAKFLNRSFSESVIFPFPKNTVQLVFYQRNKTMDWEKQYQTYVNPKDYTIVTQLAFPSQSFKIHNNAPSDKALDIVILPEGYTAAEMQKFMNDAQRFKDYLLNCKPFDAYGSKINIWAVAAASSESGTDLPGENVWKNTLFDSHFYTFGTERYLNTLNNKMVRHLAANAPYDQIYILVNTDKYGGAGIFNYYSICTSDHENSDFVFVHEFGHGFAGLADEYYTSDVSTDGLYAHDVEPWEPNITTLVAFDRKWKTMLDAKTPVPTPSSSEFESSVGVFEGAGYQAKGVYRPKMECTMKSVRYNDFCEVCSKSIVQMLEFYSH